MTDARCNKKTPARAGVTFVDSPNGGTEWDQTMSFSAFSGRTFTTVRAGFALNIVS